MNPIRALAVIAFAALLGAGCGGHRADRAVLFSGIAGHFGQKTRVVGDGQARSQADRAHREWLSTLRRQASTHDAHRFTNPPASVLSGRLEQAAKTYHVNLRRMVVRHPRQLAPDVVIESDDYVRAAGALGPIIDAIDPAHPPHTNSRVYEGVFIELVDDRGIPYALESNSLRGQIEGGQWARAEALYPFQHG